MQRSVSIAFVLALVAGASTPDSAWAQYQWRDENGRMTFSDLPPPASTPPTSVLRAPVRPNPPAPTLTTANPAGPQASAAPVDAGSAGSAAAAGTRGSSAADRELEFRKRQLERADADRKQSEKRAQNDRIARACEEARGSLRVLESGMRITQVNSQGEREYLSDETRERKLASMRQDLQQQCDGRFRGSD